MIKSLLFTAVLLLRVYGDVEVDPNAYCVIHKLQSDQNPPQSPNEQDGEIPADTPDADRPKSCDNFAATAPSHRCACGKAMHDKCDQPDPNVAMDKHCRTYCKEQNCKCLNKCTT